MPKRKDFRVIHGGRPGDQAPPGDRPVPAAIAQLLERVNEYRSLLAHSPRDDTASLVDDMEDAINALLRLEQSTQPEARHRADEYRRLIADIDAEIISALPAPEVRRP